jgi:hypothetical protein
MLYLDFAAMSFQRMAHIVIVGEPDAFVKEEQYRHNKRPIKKMDQTMASDVSVDDPEQGKRVRSRIASLEYESEATKSYSENRKLLTGSSSKDWRGRCWNWCGLTNNDLKTRRRSQIICSICGLLNVAIVLLIFLVNTFSSLFRSSR